MQGNNQGMTLPELLVTLSVAAILLAAAVPSFRSFVADARLSTTTDLLIAHINTARSEAVTRGEPVAICPSVDQSSCSNTAAWQSGWIVFTDANGQPGIRDDGDELLHVTQSPDDDVSLQSDNAYIRYNSMGVLAPG